MDDELTDAIANAVLRHLEANAEAADTVEGIHGWWLPADLAHASRECVQHALEGLVARGSLVRRPLADGRTLYLRGAGARQPKH
jgi:hypothetical protein